ncbi:hypothetical protein BDW22DRAFT_1428935 [Trametopsis cervina]|nr:hypothetical protein BDW22DRAFT_1428935 [Trametopsis cervina]
MFTTLFSAALVSALAIRGAFADFQVSTPELTACAPAHISWSGAKAPVSVYIVHADAPCDDPLIDFGEHNSTSITVTPSIAPGTSVQLSLEDADGEEAWSGTITVGSGNGTACLGTASSSVSSSVSVTSTKSASPESATTLTIPASPPSDSTTPSDTTDGSDPAIPLGAVNNGVNPTGINGASALHKLSGTAVALSALAAAFAVSF